MRVRIASLVALLFALGSCTTDSTNLNTSGTHHSAPGVGSRFVYHTVIMDSAGTIQTEVAYGADSVVATGLTFQGRTNVTQFSPLFGYEYTCRDSNGDYEYYQKPTPNTKQVGRWITLPIGSRGKRLSVTPDTSAGIWYTYQTSETRSIHGQFYFVSSFEKFYARLATPTLGSAQIERYDPDTGILLESFYPDQNSTMLQAVVIVEYGLK